MTPSTSSTKIYTAADIERVTGASTHTVKFWIRRHIIQATKATEGRGPGSYRAFPRSEVIVACLLHPLALGWQLDQTRSVSELEQIARRLRLLVRNPATSPDIEKAIFGEGQFYLTCFWFFGRELVTAIAEPGNHKFTLHEFFSELSEAPGRAEVINLNIWLRPVRDL